MLNCCFVVLQLLGIRLEPSSCWLPVTSPQHNQDYNLHTHSVNFLAPPSVNMFRLGDRKQELSNSDLPSHAKRVADLRTLSTTSNSIVTHSGPRPLDHLHQQQRSFSQTTMSLPRGSSINGTRSCMPISSTSFATQSESLGFGESQRFLPLMQTPSTAPCSSLAGGQVLVPSSQLSYSRLSGSYNSQLRPGSASEHPPRPAQVALERDSYGATSRRCQELQSAAAMLTRSVSEVSSLLCQHVEQSSARQTEQNVTQAAAFRALTHDLEEKLTTLSDAMASLKRVKMQKIECLTEAVARRLSAKKNKQLANKEVHAKAAASLVTGREVLTLGSDIGRRGQRILVASQAQGVRAAYLSPSSMAHSIDAPFAFGARLSLGPPSTDLPRLQSLLRPSTLPPSAAESESSSIAHQLQHQKLQSCAALTPASCYSTPFRRPGAPTPSRDLRALANDDDTDDDNDFFH